MTPPTLSHRPRPLRPSSSDGAFLRTFVVTFVGLLAAIAALVRITDPMAAFGSGIIPPIVSADRDYKAALYRARRPAPEVVLLGSSRIKTLRPECITALTGEPAFNFGVNAAVADDFLAIFRFLRAEPGSRLRQIVLGVEPEAFIGSAAVGRALAQSRMLGRFVSLSPADPDRIWSDLFSDASLTAALRSVWHYRFDRGALPQEALDPDGLQTRPRWDQEIRTGRFPQHSVVLTTSRAIRTRYLGEPHLSPGRLAQFQLLLREARAAGVRVTAFVPPVHPVLLRDAAGTAFQSLTDSLVRVLLRAERDGMLRYVETRSLSDFAGDSTLYYDAIHMTAGNADRLLAALYQSPRRCAVQ